MPHHEESQAVDHDRESRADELEILLYEMIGMDFWTGEGTTAKSFAEDLKAAGDGIRKIHLRVNSPGGNVFDGLAIYNTLLSHGAKITAQVDGLSASIASVITMAASEISMGDNAMMMIHNPSTVIGGDSNDMRKMADTMDKVKTSMITAYRRHTESVEEVGALMDEETWMTADETLDNGFAENVTTPDEDDDSNDLAANFAPVFAHFRRVPRHIAARFGSGRRLRGVSIPDSPEAVPVKSTECGCLCEECYPDDNCKDCVNPDCRDENCIDCPQPKVRNKPNRARASTSRTKRVDGENLTSDCFIYVGVEDEISTWHLPWNLATRKKPRAICAMR